MSIKSDVQEFQAIQAELKSINKHRRTLLNRIKELEKNIADFLISKEQPGMRYLDKKIILKEKQKCTKKPKDRNSDAVEVLRRYGIYENPDRVLEEIMNARKGPVVPVPTIKITKNRT